MPKPLTLWIAIADGEHARFVQRDGAGHPRTVDAFDSASAHLRSSDLGTDRPGKTFESAGPAHHAVGGPQDLHRTAKERFVRLVGDKLNAASVRNAFDELLLVAPARALHELRESLDQSTKAKLVGTLEKDLVKTPDHELWPHLSESLRPARHSVS
jgi:protein required for attachment to host cells